MFVDRLRTLSSASNPLFMMAREGKRTPHALVAMAVFVLLVFAAFGVPAIAIVLVTGDASRVDRFMKGSLVLFVPFALMILLMLLWVRFFEKRSPATLGLVRSGAPLSYGRGFILGMVSMGAIIGGMAAFGGVAVQVGGARTGGHDALGWAWILLAAFIVQGGAEEIVFRGWFMQVLGARHRPWIAILASSVLFCVLHGTPRPLAILNLFLFALLLSFYCLREGSVWGICGWHSAWNWTMGHVFGLAVSGHEPARGVLLDLRAVGRPLLTGGNYGPEGSVMATMVLLLGIVVVAAIGPKRGAGSEPLTLPVPGVRRAG